MKESFYFDLEVTTPSQSWTKVRFAGALGGNAVTRRAYDIEHVNPWYLNNRVS